MGHREYRRRVDHREACPALRHLRDAVGAATADQAEPSLVEVALSEVNVCPLVRPAIAADQLGGYLQG